MKAKVKTVYVCQSCGSQSPRWMGKCPDCGQWNTLVEERVEKPKDIGSAKRGHGSEPLSLVEIKTGDEDRFVTRIGELDRVLGGGIVTGSVVLIGGDPGIGKSVPPDDSRVELTRAPDVVKRSPRGWRHRRRES